jgi:hypothetical protein
MAFNIGMQGITFIAKDPRDDTIDLMQHPVALLHRAIPAAVKSAQAPPAWNPLVFGREGRSAPLTPIKDGFLLQCILMEHKSKPALPPLGSRLEDPVIVMLLSQSAGEALLRKLEERDDNGNLRYPDITDVENGMFIQFHQAGTQGPATPIGGPAPAQTEGYRYDVELYPTYHSVSASVSGISDLLARKSKQWDDIVQVLSLEEQVRKLCRSGIPASALVYALGEVYGQYIPDEVHEQARQTAQPAAAQTGWGVPSQVPSQPSGQRPPAAGGWGMAASVAGTAHDPSMPVVTPRPADDPVSPAPAVAPTQEGYDPQPTHSDPARAAKTMTALEQARQRKAAQRATQS